MVWRSFLLFLMTSPLFGGMPSFEERHCWALDSMEPSSIHLGLVNAITGDYVESSTDIRVRSVAPLAMRRTLCSSDPTDYFYASGWSMHEVRGVWNNNSPGPRGKRAPGNCWMELTHPEYGSLNFLPANNPLRWLVQHFKSVCNTGSGEISGRTNLRTIQVVYEGHPRFLMFRGDGEMALYDFFLRRDKDFYIGERQIGRMIERTLPSGFFLYYPVNGEVRSVEGYSPGREALLGWIRYRKIEGGVEVTSSDSQRVQLTIDGGGDLRRVEAEGQPWVEYDYHDRGMGRYTDVGNRPFLKRGPEGRFLNIRYYSDKMIERSERKVKGGFSANHPAVGRVHELWAPVARDGSSALIARFTYQFNFHNKKRAEFNGERPMWRMDMATRSTISTMRVSARATSRTMRG